MTKLVTGWHFDNEEGKIFEVEGVKKLLFPDGMPEKIDESLVVDSLVNDTIRKDLRCYRFKRPSIDVLKSEVTRFKTKSDRNNFISNFISIVASSQSEISWPRVGITDGDEIYRLICDDHSGIKLEELQAIVGKKVPKTMLRSIVNLLNLEGSDRALLMEYVRTGRFDLFRILKEDGGVQFTKEELLEIVDLECFSLVTFTGTFGSKETVDIMNRRAVIFHQDSCDADVVFKIIDGIKDDYSKEKFKNSLTRWKKIREKFGNDERLLLLLKLM
jgi:hypothetical protein